MKKRIILAAICAVLFLMPAFSALPIKKTSASEQKTLPLPTVDSDGTFVGGFGRMYKENNEWQFEYYGYLAGIYQNKNKYKILAGNIYKDINGQEQIGTIVMYNFKSFVVGKIKNMEGKGAPITGFLIIREDLKFAGRIMSVSGPAPNIWGELKPN
jgi:hypothetical protein